MEDVALGQSPNPSQINICSRAPEIGVEVTLEEPYCTSLPAPHGR
jgi:hypothetical protein